jgi:hypothetical protein
VTDILSAIKERVLAREHARYGMDPEYVRFDFYTSPVLTDDFWADFCLHWNMGNLCVAAPGGDLPAGGKLFAPGVKRTRIDTALNGIAQVSSMIEWVTCQIDIAFALWNGSETAHDGRIWNFIESCWRAGVPCIWIDTSDLGKSFWFRSVYPESFSRTVLWEFIDGFYLPDELPTDLSEICPKRYLFAKLWEKTSKHWEKRQAIQPVYDVSKKGTKGYGGEVTTAKTKDSVLSEDHLLECGMDDSPAYNTRRENYEFLRCAFHEHEKAADTISPVIRATLFCRTWMPLLSTLCLLAGSTETLLRYFFGGLRFQGIDMWSFAAGLGFLLAAFTYFYNRLNDAPHQKNMDAYISCRYVNEYLRIALHFLAYGLPVSEQTLRKAIRNAEEKDKQKGALRVRRLLRIREPADITLDAMAIQHITKHLNEFIDTQLEYQTTGRKLRFEGVMRRLGKGISILLWVNLITLALRALVQFGTGFFPNLGVSAAHGGKGATDIARAIANTTALVITAWYDKLVRQRDMNHYGGYCRIADKILAELRVFKVKTSEITALLEQGGKVSYERFRCLAEDTLEALGAELYWWCDETVRK